MHVFYGLINLQLLFDWDKYKSNFAHFKIGPSWYLARISTLDHSTKYTLPKYSQLILNKKITYYITLLENLES